MSRFAIAGAALALLGGGVAFAGTNAVLDDDASGGVTTSARTTTTTTTHDRADDRNRRGRGKGQKGRRGRHDRRQADRVERRRGFREAGEDVRGPCDEAEHANDPRCTGAARDNHDRSGRGRSGSNSGPG